MRGAFLLGLAGLFSILSTGLEAKGLRVKFKQDTFNFTAKVGEKFEVDDLRSLLSDIGSGNLIWSNSPDMPSWLVLDKAAQKLSGTPTAANLGAKSFKLFVQDGEMGAVTGINMTVIGPPVWSKPDIDLGIQNEGVAMTPFDLKPFVTNPAGGALAFSSNNLKPWMKLSADGIITGTPARPDVGDYKGIIFTATGIGGSSTATGFGKVLKTIKPPEWKNNPITLEDAKEDSAYSRAVSEFVNNFEQTPLTFAKVSGPGWITVSPTGVVLGTPTKPDLGAVTLTVSFTTTVDGTTFTKSTVFKFNVIHVNHAPKWAANPLVLPNGATKVAYKQELAGSASDIDTGDVLTFKVLSGPAWATITTTGTFAGTPQNADVGVNKWEVQVSDQVGASAVTTVQVTVIKSNEPPFWLSKPTILTPAAKEDIAYMIDLTGSVKDPDGDPVTFTMMNGPAWVTLTPGGVLSGTPRAADIGLNKFSVRVTDNISGNDVTDVLLEVVHVNHPPEWLMNPIRISVPEKKLMNVSIAAFAKDVDKGDALGFQLLPGGPAWVMLDVDGTFTGTPQPQHIGENVYNVRVIDNAGASADTKVIITVENVNDKPYWTKDPIVLANAKENTAYTGSVTEFAKDDDPGDVLTFSKVSGPSWLSVSSTGVVSGTPSRSNLGLNSFQVRVTDKGNESAVATVQITVEKVNTPPRWRQNPILMADGFDGKPYTFGLALYAVDDDGDPLTFKKIAGPAWMNVAADGSVTGTPKKEDIGDFTATFEVSDGKAAATADGKGRVLKTNHPPVISNEIPHFIVKERGTLTVSFKTYVTDPDGDSLTFTLANPPSWITFFTTGDATFKPLHAHLGDHSFPFTVTDGEFQVPGTLKVRVIEDPRPPIWLENPIRMEAKTNELFKGDVSTKAIEQDSRPLTFSKKAGKDWLTVDSKGGLLGTPKDADFGENVFTLTVCNDKQLCADAQLIIDVKWGTQVDTVQIDSAVPGAKAENLWIVDTSNNCSQLTQSFRSNIKYYLDELTKAGIHHTGVYLSPDAHAYDGLPFKGSAGNWLLEYTQMNWVTDFTWRMDKSLVSGGRLPDSDLRCGGGNCYNSPIWSMFRFYERAPGLEFYHQGYFTAGVPMDVMIATQQRDHFKWYAQNKPQKNWTASDYAQNYLQFNEKEKQSLRISAIAPECPSLISEETAWAAPENAYRVLVNKTRGQYYSVGDCSFNVRPHLVDYAKKVIFRAFVYAKGRIKLSKQPKDPSTIKVTLGGMELTGNTGAATDKWKYDSATNEIVVFWTLIDEGQLKPGDQIKIEYRVS